MCIIAVKPANVAMIDNQTIENCWYNNDDGAGFMYPAHGGVKIRKGFMTLKALKKALKTLEKEIDTTATPIILHFRIGTSGGNIAANTHPFPVSESLAALQKTQLTTPLAVAHNGIIDIRPRKKDISDTMEYILSQLAPLYQLKKDFYRLEAGKQLIYNAIQSKMAFMDAAGRISLIGKFEKNGEYYFSNSSYQTYYRSYSYWDKWDDYSFIKWSKKGYTARLLQWLDDRDGYIITDSGEIVEAFDYLLDSSDDLYIYDYALDAAIPVGGRAYTHAGTPLKWNADKAEMMEVFEASGNKYE
jgi:predicted glutamine amidotransferase